VTGALGWLYRLVYAKYRVDEAYDAVVIRPVVRGSASVLWRGVDIGLIDGMVNGVGFQARGVGAALRLLQSGNIRSYAAWVVAGAVLAVVFFGFFGGAR
jgi:NADH-quinone oxidoreductase subunit L